MIIKRLSEILLDESNQSVPEFVQLMRVGKWTDEFYGPFEISTKMLKEMKANFDNKVRRVDLAIDFAHMNHLEAAGWIKNIDVRNNDEELWAEIDWTVLGKEKVGGKLYRYLSAEYDTQYIDKETGKSWGHVLLGAGLTNRPFIKGMKATTSLAEEKVMEEKIKKLEEDNVKLGDEVKALNDSIKSLSEAKASLEKENSELKAKIELEQKEAEFSKMLSECKVVPAQKDAWIKGDLVEFAAKASNVKINLDEKGHGKDIQVESKSEDDLISEAKKLSESENISMADAISKLLASDEFSHLNKKGGE